MKKTTKTLFNLEDRLIEFSVTVINVAKEIPDNKSCGNLTRQLIRSGTAPALNYAEAQSGESRRDFIHKLKIVLKELRETLVCLKIIEKSACFCNQSVLEKVKKENNELISIIVKSIETAKKNMYAEKRRND